MYLSDWKLTENQYKVNDIILLAAFQQKVSLDLVLKWRAQRSLLL